jgi:hypothetical protein
MSWQPLVSPCQWAGIAHALASSPPAIDDLCVALEQLSGRVRITLMANLLQAVESDPCSTRAVWSALAITRHELTPCLAEALGRLHAAAEDAPLGRVKSLAPTH